MIITATERRNAMIAGVLAMAVIVTASNILVQHLLGDWLTWGARFVFSATNYLRNGLSYIGSTTKVQF
ncbi:MAG: hypothetical protein AAGD47_11635, partial [Pseudomonadota bacterium]